jgi:hypothetical protein
MISLPEHSLCGILVCHDTTVMTYAAYLRIYEPIAAFHEPDRSRWAAYAASPARPRRRDSLAAEQAEALYRAIAAAEIAVPDQESEHAYVRRVDGVTYICPWQTRLRCLLSYGRLILTAGSALPGVVPAREDTETLAALTRLADDGRPGPAVRLHILASVWTVPLAWFVPFAAAERWLALGSAAKRPSTPQTASATRALLYTTSMSRARKRVARGLAALRGLPRGFADVGWDPDRAETELAEVGRWLEDFHPYSLVELDYGGLVQLLSDDALSGDQSAAEIAAAVDGIARGERELAVAMYSRARSRWRALAEYEMAN